ncbi:hypothetical protein Pint_30624 [Pistacia integerrima]|uniref:Uncharacterized protein n=1 Tax=Pistacia integerrima TaxID=434235 RepID=A0ACC0WX14_9ROSI|nr:hypothetical protein Pint_30624 [Pistacia integerrima]
MSQAKKVLSTAASLAASAMLVRSIANDFLPSEVQHYFYSSLHSVSHYMSSQLTIVIEEFQGLSTNQLFEAAHLYLGVRTTTTSTKRLRVGKTEKDNTIEITLDRNEEIFDFYENVKLKWRLACTQVPPASSSDYRNPKLGDYNTSLRSEVRQYELSFHKKHKDMALNLYLPHVLEKAKAIKKESNMVKLHTVVYNRWDVNQVTLSGLLNFIDGLWSCCGDERIIIFTTNHKERLDPALLRPGRMDMHINMSYCTASVFKQLAFSYLGISHHHLFEQIEELIMEVEVTPAEVAGELMKSTDADISLQALVKFFHAKMAEQEKAKTQNKIEL